jgi:acrylyl-CoA reductase (NADPH)
MCAWSAIVVTESESGRLQRLSEGDLPAGDVTVRVAYSSLNYKDGLAVTGVGRVVRRFPMVCGIDLAGTVESSDSPEWQEGDEVVVTGWGLSESHPGGYTQRQRVRSEWLVRRPDSLSLRQTMSIGTAGLTAMLCILALERAGLSPTGGAGGEVLVTGAGGGVGSVAVAVLAHLGYQVAASTGRTDTHDHLRALGARSIVERHELATSSGRPLDKERWSAAVDTVGSETLASVLRQIRYRGAVAACGLAGGSDLPTTVLPFILRNVSLLGIDSVQCPTVERTEGWRRLGLDLPTSGIDSMTTVEPMSRIPELAEAIMAGRITGRVVIDVNA